jgi:RNA polymerase sigma-70 factor (ECF subfamily)
MTEKAGAGHTVNEPPRMTSPQHILPLASSAGRIPSFEQVYEDYFDFAWIMLRRLGVRSPHLEDAVQELFIVVHRRLREFAGRSSLKTWLAGIAWRVASEHRRHESRKGGTEPLPDDLLADHRDPHRAAVYAESLRLLDHLLGQLDGDKRVVFVLAELEQMRVPEIAEALSLNLNTVYSRLRAARKAFDEALQLHRGNER